MQAQALPAAQAQHHERARQVIEALKRLPVPANDVGWLQLVDVGVTVQTAFKSLRDRHLSARDRTRVTSALSAARDELQRRTERQAEWRDALARLPAADLSTLERPPVPSTESRRSNNDSGTSTPSLPP